MASQIPFAARHSCDSPEWHTPSVFVDAARRVMGGIDLDPMSHEEANRTVKATRFFSVTDNGLAQKWFGRIFINPAGGLVPEAWRKLMCESLAPEFEQAIWIGYSLEQLQTLQRVGAAMTPLDFPICVTKQRIAFVENEAKQAARKAKLISLGKKPNAKSSPSHSNYISYIGPNNDAFVRVFSAFGKTR